MGNAAFTQLVGGQPLPAPVRNNMEARFGADFTGVRVHNGAQAHEHTTALNAKAYTVGEHIAFSPHRFAPQTSEGQRLLAHELAHVVQQRRGGAAPSENRGGAAEQGAQSAAQAVVGGSGAVSVSGATGVGVACEKEDKKKDEDEQQIGQASTTVLTQKRLKASPDQQHIDVVKNPDKARGTGAEINVPFDRYAGPEWNHIGGGSETASSRTSLARQSSHDKQMGHTEGTAGIDFIVEHVPTGRLVIGEQKATGKAEFSKATAITTSLADNIQHSVDVLRQQIKDGKVHPQEVSRLENTIARLEATHKALQNPGNDTRLPPGVVFELTNVGGKGETIGNAHLSLLEKAYGGTPGFLQHLLERTYVRDAALAKAKGRSADGKPGTDSDPDTVPAMDLLNDPAKDTLERLKSGKSKSEWAKQKNAEKAAENKAQAKQKAAAALAAKQAKANKKAELDAARAAAKQQLKDQAQQAASHAEQAHLDQLKAQRKQAGQPEPTTKKVQNADAVAARKAGRDAKSAHIRNAEAADAAKAAATQQQKAAERAQQRQAKQQANAAKKQESARRAQEAKAVADALARFNQLKNPSPTDLDRPNKGDHEALTKAAALDPARTLSPADRETLKKAAAKDPKLAAQLNEKVNKKQTQDFEAHAKKNNADVDLHNSSKRPSKNDERASKAAHRLNQAAGAVRGLDAFNKAREDGKGYLEAGADAGYTYLENTNPLLGAKGTFDSRMQLETVPGSRTEQNPQGRQQQVYGEDAGDAFFGTLGENIAGYIVPGKGWDQLINGGANLIGAVDDHNKRGDAPVDPREEKASVRTGTDLAAELTPSRMFSSIVGSGMRAYYDLGKAAAGQTSGVDKFADDGVRGKLGAIIQPWAMAADFVGELGGSDAGTALNKVMDKSKGTTLSKLGDASGDAMYNLGESQDAKSGRYGGLVQSASTVLGVTSDMIAGRSFNQAIDEAAGEGSTDAKVVAGARDAAVATQKFAGEVWNEDLPAARARASQAIDTTVDKAKAVIDNPGAAFDSAAERAKRLLDW